MIAYSIYYFGNKKENPKTDDVEQVSDEEKIESANLRLGISNIDNLNPIVSKNQNVQDISKLIYEPLFDLTSDFKLENALGTEFSKTDSKTYLVKLREGVKWHNEETFSSEDVKFTIDTIKNLGNNSIYNANVSNIESVEIVANNLIKIHLFDEKPLFEYNLTFPIISRSVFGGDDISNSDKNNKPIGTGKYRANTIDVASQIELKKNDNWWNKNNVTVRIDTITVRIYKTVAEVYNAYKLGGIDMITTNSTNIEEHIGTIGSNIKESYGRNFEYIALNCSNNILINKEVRQAISYLIDKQQIINNVYEGKEILADHPLAYGSYLYDKEKYNYERNVDKAKEILQSGGWVNNYGAWQKKVEYNTLRLKLNLVVQGTDEKRVNVRKHYKRKLS